MLGRAFALIDGEAQTPAWFAPYVDVGRRVAAARRPSLAEALNAAMPEPFMLAAGPLTFVPQQALPPGEAYESFIARTACVPTRDHPHDLFNGLVWMRFPALKRRLNELQAHEIAQRGVGPTRGAVRDALTLFDENAAVLQGPQCIVDALRVRDWHGLFVARRAAWRDARVTLFGHALMEKLCLTPHKAITAHVWTAPAEADLQRHLVDALDPQLLASKAHLALPVLGVPGWCDANEDPNFYDDSQVFRPLRR